MIRHVERDLYLGQGSLVPLDFLQSLFVAELIRPSQRLWICSAWISDIPLVDNSARQFSSIDADWPAGPIRVSRIVSTLLSHGSDVIVITNESPHNSELLQRLEGQTEVYPEQLRLLRSPNLHQKGIVGDHFTLDGSMNFTFNGVLINEEHVIYRTDPEVVAERRLEMEHRWGAQL